MSHQFAVGTEPGMFEDVSDDVLCEALRAQAKVAANLESAELLIEICHRLENRSKRFRQTVQSESGHK